MRNGKADYFFTTRNSYKILMIKVKYLNAILKIIKTPADKLGVRLEDNFDEERMYQIRAQVELMNKELTNYKNKLKNFKVSK